mmetsp:Transcript_16493/g.19508  ORF Transcript_16493/g.19508 Transcript_16493/m.19508 type:complete len:82 (+) Transcript_16493:132-377(+)
MDAEEDGTVTRMGSLMDIIEVTIQWSLAQSESGSVRAAPLPSIVLMSGNTQSDVLLCTKEAVDVMIQSFGAVTVTWHFLAS